MKPRCAALGGSLVVLVVLLWSAGAAARDLRLSNGTDVPVTVHAADGPLLFLWLPSGYGSQSAEAPLARELARRGIEVWQADVLEGRLLPPLESSLEQVPAEDVALLIDAAAKTGKRVLLVAAARAGLLALAGGQHWLAQRPRTPQQLAGVILLHPNLYVGPPAPGREAEYHARVAQNRLPVFIFQPEQSPWRWRLAPTRAELEKGGAAVYTWLLTDVRDRFYFRPDATGGEAVASRRLAGMLRAAAGQLAATAQAPMNTRPAVAANQRVAGTRGLQVYRGDPVPPPLALATLDGRRLDLAALRGKVVLVNFWASWCPPCVHEMPSMQRLKDKLAGRPFEILAVNMGESEREVRVFLRDRVRVDFPIPMDRDGRALKAWKVFVFPTSFVLDAEGHIRLGVFGEVEWDSPEVMAPILGLMPRS